MLFETILTYYLIFTHPVSDRRSSVDLRPYFPRVFDQGRGNSCTANAIASVVSFHENRQDKKAQPISRLDLYHRSRIDPHDDGGASLQRSLYVLEHECLCDEKLWPYSWKRLKSDPPKRCVDKRKKHAMFKPFNLPPTSRCIAYAVRTYHPVVIGTFLPMSFDKCDTIVPPLSDPIISKHAMVVVGVTENDERFVIRNSWGTKWKSKGYITVPRLFIDRFVVDSWILTPLQ